jgi:hypothetical protein
MNGNTTHGLSKTPEYDCWNSMIGRCLRPRHPRFYDYGGRGITVCKRWLKFENFLEDMGKRPKGLELDRINNDRGYSPDNCYWRTKTEQMNNTRHNRVLEYQGIRRTVSEWSKITGIHHSIIRSRLNYGWSIERILTTQSMRPRQ